VYDADPQKDPSAKKFEHIEYIDALNRRLQVMDSTALSLCMENHLAIRVFDVFQPGSIRRILEGADTGTLVSDAVPATAPSA
jgi:uridylate kinase